MFLIYNTNAIISVGLSGAFSYLIYEFILNKQFPDVWWISPAMFIIFGFWLLFLDRWIIYRARSKGDPKAGGGSVWFIPVWIIGLLVFGIGIMLCVQGEEAYKEIKDKDAPAENETP